MKRSLAAVLAVAVLAVLSSCSTTSNNSPSVSAVAAASTSATSSLATSTVVSASPTTSTPVSSTSASKPAYAAPPVVTVAPAAATSHGAIVLGPACPDAAVVASSAGVGSLLNDPTYPSSGAGTTTCYYADNLGNAQLLIILEFTPGGKLEAKPAKPASGSSLVTRVDLGSGAWQTSGYITEHNEGAGSVVIFSAQGSAVYMSLTYTSPSSTVTVEKAQLQIEGLVKAITGG